LTKKKEKAEKKVFRCDTCLFLIEQETKPEKCPNCAATDVLEVKKAT